MNTSLVYSDLERKSRAWRERGDCAVKAIAIALDICYAEAWYACRKAGRQYQSGMIMLQIRSAFESKKKELVPINFIGDLGSFMQQHPKGVFVFEIPGHIMVYKNGVFHDNAIHWFGRGCLEIYHVMDFMDLEDVNEH